MITTIILVIGVLFILNGFTSMMNARTVEGVRAAMPEGCDIYTGSSKGLFCLSSTDAMIAVRKNGSIEKAFLIRRGWLRKSNSAELSLSGKMEQLANKISEMKPMEQKACTMALHQYTRTNRRKRR